MSETPSFKSQLERLEEIVRALEGEDLDLDRALELFEEGVERLRTARTLLEDSESKIKKVLEAANGTLKARDADV